MARPRKPLQTNADGRYRLQVGQGHQPKYLYLGTKDRSKAANILEMVERPLADGDIDEVERRIKYLRAANDPKEFFSRWNELGNKDDPLWGLDVETDADGNVTARYDERSRLILDDEYLSPPLVDKSDEVFRYLVDQGRYVVIAQRARELIDLLQYGDPELFKRFVSYVDDLAGKRKNEKREPASEQRLSDCLAFWQDWKRDSIGKAYYRAHTTAFDNFVEKIGNLALNQITKKHFLDYERHIKKMQGDKTSKWAKNQLYPLVAILQLAMRKTDWDFPDGLLNWMQFDYGKYSSQVSNRQPMPVEVFKALIKKADDWGSIDVGKYAEALPITAGANEGMAKRNNIKQANRVKRAGIQWSAMLKLGACVGSDNVDLCRIKWENLRLDKKLPYMEFSRGKVKKQVGDSILRLTPLLPSVVESLKAWQAYETNVKFPEHVFSNDARRPFEGSKISEGFSRLRKAINGDGEIEGNGWSFKHIRNIGPSIGKRHKRHPDEREAFLGHVVRETSRFYEGDVDEGFLTGLVNLIGAEYFDGETVEQSQ